jgi:peptidyl-prolyl cis-trans isomerase A (cyclophilin A)
MSYLDADPKDPKGNPGFAAFGQVVEGLDVVRRIIALPVDPNRGEGAMKGEMLVKPVKIVHVTRVK